MTSTAEERAKAVVEAARVKHFKAGGDMVLAPETPDIEALIAQAIRSAENEKLEEAASRLILETQPKPDQSFSVGDELLMQGAAWSATFIRSLKSKDTP